MSKRGTQQGFGVIGVVVIVAVLAVVGFGAWYVYHRNHHKNPSPAIGQEPGKGSTNTGNTNPPTQNTSTYLTINELGIRLKLTDPIKDAYYRVKSGATVNGKPVIALDLHSWDAYTKCAPANNADGVAAVMTFTPGATDPVNGDMATAYPDAPLVGNLHYYISQEQFDCTDGAASNVSAVRDAFTAAYKTIEAE